MLKLADVRKRLPRPAPKRCGSNWASATPARGRLRPGRRADPYHRPGAAAASARHRHPAAPSRPGAPAALVSLAPPPPVPRPPRPPTLERLRRGNTVITTNYSRHNSPFAKTGTANFAAPGAAEACGSCCWVVMHNHSGPKRARDLRATGSWFRFGILDPPFRQIQGVRSLARWRRSGWCRWPRWRARGRRR